MGFLYLIKLHKVILENINYEKKSNEKNSINFIS
jgi:hypothetical protein